MAAKRPGGRGRKEDEEYLNVFRARWKARGEAILNTKLLVAILGPSDGSPGWPKREQIRDRLSSVAGPRCVCFFPEDEIATFGPSGQGSLRIKEGEMLPACELVVALDVSPGVLAEIEDFARDPEIALRMLILVPNTHRAGYSAQGTLRETAAEVHWFTDEEFTSCELIRVCEERAVMEKEQKAAGLRMIHEVDQLRKRYHYE